MINNRKKHEVIENERFERLVVLREVYPIDGHTAVLVKCDCNKEFIVRYYSLKSKNTKSCGCLRDEKTVERNIKSAGKPKNGYTLNKREYWDNL